MNISIYHTHETELQIQRYDAMNRGIKCQNIRDRENPGSTCEIQIWIGRGTGTEVKVARDGAAARRSWKP